MKKTIFTLFSMALMFGAGSVAQAQEQAHQQNQEQTPAQEPEQTIADQNSAKIDQLEEKVNKWGNLKVSGYIQGQWQWAESKGAAAFGDGGSFNKSSDNRFMIRRGRVKVTYTKGIMQAVIQPDFTEKGVSIKDVYLSVTSKSKVIAGQIGLFDRPFGYEISYSSSLRESPERSRVYLSLFPGERDCGTMLTLKGKSGWLSQFTLNAGLFNGNGVGVETDSRKDFIGRLAWLKKSDNSQLGFAFSYYYGGVLNPAVVDRPAGEVYRFAKGEGFKASEVKVGSVERRQYFGLAGQYLQQWGAGTTNLRAEFLMGDQPGTFKNNNDPSGNSFGAGTDPLYLRQFAGGYAILVQDIGRSKHSIVLKYDYYDPNTSVSGNQIGQLAGTGAADVAYSTYGIGYLFRWNQHIRLMAYYDYVDNEKSANLKGFGSRIKQNVFTARVQVKF